MERIKERTMGWVQKVVTKSTSAVTHSQPWFPKLCGFQPDKPEAQRADADLLYSLAQSDTPMCAGMHTCIYMGIYAWVYMYMSEIDPEGKPQREWRPKWAVGMRVGSGGGMKQQAASNDFSPRQANSIFSYICNLRNAFSGLFWLNSQNMLHKINSTK